MRERRSRIRQTSAVAHRLAGNRLKVRIRKLAISAPFGLLFPAQLAANRVQLLPMEPRHIEPLTTLPFHHNDPFDRLIVATSLVENLKLVSPDAILDAYGVTRLW
jgi:PIN domain nuclease of toxin-antitoxin system